MDRPANRLLCTLVAVAIFAPCAAAHGAVRITSATHSVAAGGRARLAIVAPTGARSCWLDFVRDGRRRQSSAAVAVTGPGIAWSWRVPTASRTGRWVVRVLCTTSSRTQRGSSALRVRRGGARYKLAAVLSVSQSAAQAPPTGTAVAPQGPNPFPWGQCTFWAYEKRPDIFDQSSHAVSWEALRWADNARAAGFPVDGASRAGDIAVFQPGHQGAFGTGHLAYVESVNGNGSFNVSEMNANGNPNLTYATRPAPGGDPGIQFIHRR